MPLPWIFYVCLICQANLYCIVYFVDKLEETRQLNFDLQCMITKEHKKNGNYENCEIN